MSVHDDLGCRMKTFYEQIPKTKLMRRCPVALRIDGKAFHTFTSSWIIDKEIPIFKGEGRDYIDRLIYVGED